MGGFGVDPGFGERGFEFVSLFVRFSKSFLLSFSSE